MANHNHKFHTLFAYTYNEADNKKTGLKTIEKQQLLPKNSIKAKCFFPV